MYKKLDLFFGFFVIGVFMWFIYSILSSTNKFSLSYNFVDATFSSVEGITQGSLIKIAGVEVGEVTKIELDENKYLAKISFKINSNIKLPTDSSAVVESSGLLGAKYIAIYPGIDEENIKNGGSITITQGSLNLEKIINNFISGGFKS